MAASPSRDQLFTLSLALSDQLTGHLSDLRGTLVSAGVLPEGIAGVLTAGVVSAWASTMRDLGFTNERIAADLRAFASTIGKLPEPNVRGDRGQS